MLDNLPFDPRLLAGVQSSLMPAAETPPAANTDLPPEADQPTAPSTQQPQPNGEAAKANPESGRDAQGKFAKGCKGGPGNPFARQTAAYRKALRAAVSAEDVQAMTRLLRDQALQGNLAAIKMVFLYTIGKPGETVDPDLLDAQELQLFQRQTATSEQMVPVLQGMQASLACELLRAAVPEIQDTLQEQLSERLHASLAADEERKAEQAKQSEGEPEAESRRRRKKRDRQGRRRQLPSEPTGSQTVETVPPSPNGSTGGSRQTTESRESALQPPLGKREKGLGLCRNSREEPNDPAGWEHDQEWYLDESPDRRKKHRHGRKKKKKKRHG